MALGKLSWLWGLHWAGCVLVAAVGESAWLDLSCRSGPTHTVLLPGQEALLQCDLDNEKGPPNITWWKDEKQLVAKETLRILPNGTLVISQGDGDNIEGSYFCIIQTSFGVVMGRTGKVTLARLPPFHQQPEAQSVVQNGLAWFECGIIGLPTPKITWQKDKVPIPADPRFVTLSSGVLQISGVQEEDAGLYRCVASNILSTRYSNEAQLLLKQDLENLTKELTISRAPRNLTVEAGQSAVMECTYEGDVSPLVSWTRQDEQPISSDVVLLGKTNLLIQHVQPHHAGVYVCRANKPLSQHFVTSTAHLHVLVPPVIIQPPETITRARAGTARFVCRVEGEPEPSISWLKNGHVLHSNGRVRIQVRGSLVITQIALEDAGYYQCIAENVLGSSCATAKLYVTVQDGLPGPPQAVRAQAVSSKSVTVTWAQPENNWERVIGFSLHYTKTGGSDNMEYQFAVNNDTTEFNVRDLEPGTSYTFYLVAYSQQGASRASHPVMVQTWDDVPGAAPSLSLSSETPNDIRVSWIPLAPELTNGHIIKYRIEYCTQKNDTIHSLEVAGDETQVTLVPLQPNKLYKVRISASTTAGFGAWSNWIQHRTPERGNQTQVDHPPLELKVSARTYSLSLSWQLPPSENLISGFRLYYRMVCPDPELGVPCTKQGGNLDVGPIKLKKKRRQYEITELMPAQMYQVKLVAFNKKQEGQTAVWMGRTKQVPLSASDLPTQKVPRLPPSHIEVEPNSSTSMWVSWKRPNSGGTKILNYTVRCGPWGAKNSSLVTYHSSTSEGVLITGLKPYTKYEFAVQSSGFGVDGPFSNTVEKMTLQDRPSSPPADLVVHPVSQFSVQVHWRPPVESNGIIVQYLIMFSTNSSYPDEMWTVLIKEGNVFSTDVPGLRSGTKYFFKMGAKTMTGWGPYTNLMEVETLPPRSPGAEDVLDMNSVTGIIVGVCVCLLCLLLCMCASFQQSKQRDSGSDLGARSNRGPISYQRARQGSCSQSHCQDSHELETLMPPRQEDTSSVPAPEVTDLIEGHSLVTHPQLEDKNQVKMKPSWNGSVTQNWANHITSYAETITGETATAANGSANALPMGGLRMTLHDFSYESVKQTDVTRSHRNPNQNQVEADVIVHSDFSASERSGRCTGLESEEEEDLSLDPDKDPNDSLIPVSSPLKQALVSDNESKGWHEQPLISINTESNLDTRTPQKQPLVNGFHRNVDAQELQTANGIDFNVEGEDPCAEDLSPASMTQQDLMQTSPGKLCPES
ncbi:immunoglobulin superfamily DCC subclass member 4 isoform X3 [Spea bombifrons]|uniref:immunoglobulin superfamily DCC subclass member 4 isoform X3 n=1 Tax=Spea bombifrons TaxID=233779 RepID=UPI0023492718|nr:immunoglobulin superfamily DCC subclass member 4 isoform X3 [Spea bombifrons]